MEEIVNINGIPYRISAENVSPQQWSEIKAEQIRKLQATRPMSLAPGTCPASIVQGSTHTFNVTVTGGVSPFSYALYNAITGEKLLDHPTKDQLASFSFTYNFPQAPGSYTFSIEIKDSCALGEQVAYDTCDTTITPPPCPLMSVTFNLSA